MRWTFTFTLLSGSSAYPVITPLGFDPLFRGACQKMVIILGLDNKVQLHLRSWANSNQHPWDYRGVIKLPIVLQKNYEGKHSETRIYIAEYLR